jgi:SAM-dependent methyltransferase
MMRRIIAALMKRWGSSAAKQRVWDSEYKTGKWTYDRKGHNNEANEPIYRFLEKYGTGGTILDLGCGSGMTALEMKNTFREYVGVDVSDIAIQKARAALSEELSRAKKVRFFVSDIATFEPDGQFSIILYRESIYYVPQHKIKAMLDRYCSHLLTGGVFIVRLCNRDKYKGIISLLEGSLRIIEKYASQDSTTTILVCSPTKMKQNA